MKDLEPYKDKLRQLLPDEGGIFVIDSLIEALPSSSSHYNAIISLKRRFKELKVNSISGILTADEQDRLEAILNKQLLELIQLLEPSDFDPKTEHSQVSDKQKIRRGHVLYRIPQEMQLQEEYRCLVRIAFDEEMVLEDLKLDEDTALKSGIRISQYMKVEIKDPSTDPAFAIHSRSEPVQFIDEDDFTEWRFQVKPLKSGEHVLELTVTIIQRINGEDHMRERTLEESVVIITEPTEAVEEDLPWKKDKDTMVMPYALHTITPTAAAATAVKPTGSRSIGGSFSSSLMGVALVLIVSTAAYAFGPVAFREQLDWLITQYLQDSTEAYADFIDQYPKSSRKETAILKKAEATIRDQPQEKAKAVETLTDYLTTYGDKGQYTADIYWALAQLTQLPDYFAHYLELPGSLPQDEAAQKAINTLESQLWSTVERQPSAAQLDRYLRLYPKGAQRQTAIQWLTDSIAWQQAATLPPNTLSDTIGWQSRLRKLANELTDVTQAEQLRRWIARGQLPPINQLTPQQINFPATNDARPTEEAGPTDNTRNEAGPSSNSNQGEGSPSNETGITETGKSSDDTTATEQAELDKTTGLTNRDTTGVATAVETLADTENKLLDETPNVIAPPTEAPKPNGSEANTTSLPPSLAGSFVRIAGGTFTMGCQTDRDGSCQHGETPTRQVTVSTFYLSKFEVTQALWLEVMGTYPNKLNNRGCGQCPVENVNWSEIQSFLQTLNAQTGQTYRLPTEAEWEYAARGGQQSKGYRYSGSNELLAVAWYTENYRSGNNSGYKKTTRPVGQQQANELGLYDMSGNVYEWCSDWYGRYPTGAQTNPKGASSGSNRVVRGGGWHDSPADCRIAFRYQYAPAERNSALGFRLVREAR